MSSMTKEKYQRCTQKLAAMWARDLRPSVLWRGEDLKSFVMTKIVSTSQRNQS